MSKLFKGTFWGDYFNPAIPTQFDDALSYAQQIRRLYARVGQAIQMLDSSNNETLQELKKLQQEVDELRKSIIAWNANIEMTNSRIDRLEKTLVNYVNDLQNQINTLITAQSSIENRQANVESDFIAFKNVIENRYRELQSQLMQEIQTAISVTNGNVIRVTNPKTSQVDTLVRTLVDIWNRFNNSIVVGDFEIISITVQEVEELNLTVEELEANGSMIFWSWWARQTDPGITADKVTELSKRVGNVENELSDYQKQTDSHIAKNDSDIATLKSESDILNTDIAGINHEIILINSTNNTQNTRLNSVENAVISAQSSADNAQEFAERLESEIDLMTYNLTATDIDGGTNYVELRLALGAYAGKLILISLNVEASAKELISAGYYDGFYKPLELYIPESSSRGIFQYGVGGVMLVPNSSGANSMTFKLTTTEFDTYTRIISATGKVVKIIG